MPSDYRHFLRYVVEKSLDGERERLKESVIGSEVFGRPPGYDPKAEPIVRTEARRLRARIEEYYARQDRWYRIRISIPKGSYAAVFEEGNRLAEAVPPPARVEPAAIAAPAARGYRWLVWPSLGIVLVSAAFFLLYFRAPARPDPILTTLTSYPGQQEFPALSPDGNEVAFAWSTDEHPIRHIYVAPVRGGEPEAITSGPTADIFPEWSPDGSQIAFIRENQWLTLAGRRGGGERRLGNGYNTSVSWSPDGRWIAHSAWTADGRHIALFETDPVTGTTRQISFPKEENEADVGASFSPDGRRLAFSRCGASACGVYEMPSQGGPARRISIGLGVTTGVTWTANGRELLVAWRRSGWSQLWRVDASGSGRQEAIPVAGDDVHWAKLGRGPNGRVVYEQRTLDSNIWRLDAGSAARRFGEPRRLIASTRLDSSPQFSPDGRSIIFVSNRSGYDELWRADADGRNETALTNLRMQALGSPRWSPDGTRIAFDATSSEGRAIFVVAATGGPPRQWTPAKGAGRPSWSHDRKSIYYTESDSAGVVQIWKTSAEEARRPRQQVTTDGSVEAYESPDGQTLYYIHGQHLRRMSTAGGAWSPALDRQVSHGWWAVTPGGIFFADLLVHGVAGNVINKGHKPVYRWDPASGAIEKVAEIDGDIISFTPDFCVSPDDRTMLYSRLEIAVSQVRMIEGL